MWIKWPDVWLWNVDTVSKMFKWLHWNAVHISERKEKNITSCKKRNYLNALTRHKPKNATWYFYLFMNLLIRKINLLTTDILIQILCSCMKLKKRSWVLGLSRSNEILKRQLFRPFMSWKSSRNSNIIFFCYLLLFDLINIYIYFY